MYFNTSIKDPNEKFYDWVSRTKLPKSNYLNKSVRGKYLLDLDQDTLEYISWKCRSCNDLLKKQAKFLYYANLYKLLAELEIDEEDYDTLVLEDFPEQEKYIRRRNVKQ